MDQHDKTIIGMDKARIEGLIARKEGPGAVQFSLGEGGPIADTL